MDYNFIKINSLKDTPKEYCSIYVLLFPNNTFYIGSTKCLKTRIKCHLSELKSNKHYNYRVQKIFNKEKTFKLFCFQTSLEERLTIEQKLLDTHITNNDCLNIAKTTNWFGGDGQGKEVHQYDLDGNFIKSYKTMTSAENFYNLCNGTIARVSNGAHQTVVGYQWSRVKKDKLSKVIYRKKHDNEFTFICKYTRNGHFVEKYKSCLEAAIANNISDTTLVRALTNNKYSAAGYKWLRFKESEKIPDYFSFGESHAKHKKVVQLSLDNKVIKIYNNATEAALELGRRRLSLRIHEACQGKAKTVKKFKWKYYVGI